MGGEHKMLNFFKLLSLLRHKVREQLRKLDLHKLIWIISSKFTSRGFLRLFQINIKSVPGFHKVFTLKCRSPQAFLLNNFPGVLSFWLDLQNSGRLAFLPPPPCPWLS
jgi:hypothetical protein